MAQLLLLPPAWGSSLLAALSGSSVSNESGDGASTLSWHTFLHSLIDLVDQLLPGANSKSWWERKSCSPAWNSTASYRADDELFTLRASLGLVKPLDAYETVTAEGLHPTGSGRGMARAVHSLIPPYRLWDYSSRLCSSSVCQNNAQRLKNCHYHMKKTLQKIVPLIPMLIRQQVDNLPCCQLPS